MRSSHAWLPKTCPGKRGARGVGSVPQGRCRACGRHANYFSTIFQQYPQPHTQTLRPARAVPVNSHSETPRSPSEAHDSARVVGLNGPNPTPAMVRNADNGSAHLTSPVSRFRANSGDGIPDVDVPLPRPVLLLPDDHILNLHDRRFRRQRGAPDLNCGIRDVFDLHRAELN